MNNYAMDELKLIYRILHRNLHAHTDLLDSRLFEDMQRHLQKLAQSEGVEVADHGAWDAWLGNEPTSCADRVARRTTLS